jgi:hypothetical protein
MARSCINHKSQQAVTMCHQCHKPICKSCTMVTPQGNFCSSECSIIFREFKEKMKASASARKPGLGMKLIVILLLVAGALVLIHLGARNGVDPLVRVDVIGRILKNAETLKR